ncbi:MULTISPECIES: GAF and ANTAR domain-containing protein [unclassified Arthrobacter]|uniref:GAF and ANTAR domain-containing protein n=1 Tax=unclassified Arthrobacter TaxID=235627 RepID=UPI001C841763|nr:GAF and ANTAR domain-containing protein [Arthrobacter sp. MAHUQ-56]MBX7446093.1 GAF and ANTAR domain-containing protein [Arthrobacter sp. MAHUQ-56]
MVQEPLAPEHPLQLSEYFQDLQDLVLDSPDVEVFLNELATVAAEGLSAAPFVPVVCGVTLLRRKKATTVASSDPTAKGMDELQNTFREGPCLTAMGEMRSVLVPDTAQEHRWPGYVAAAAEQGIRSILSVPLLVDDATRAALNLYASRSDAFSGPHVSRAEAFAAQASKSLRLALKIAQLNDARNDMALAMQSRTAIDLAAGIVMAQNRCSQSAAMEIIKAASNARNIKLRELAQSIVESVAAGAGVTTHFDE